MYLRRPPIKKLFQCSTKGKTTLVSPESGQQIVYFGATVNNRSGGAATVGVTFPIDTSRWKAGQWDDSAGASYTDDTTDAQDAGASDFALTTTTNNDGFVVQCLDKFGVVAIDVGTAEAGSPVYEYTYWNGAWTALTTCVVSSAYTAAEHVIAFPEPGDWTALATGDTPVDTDGLTAGYYAIRMRATTAPTTAPLATKLYVAELYDFKEAVADNGVVNFIVEDTIQGLSLPGGQGIGALFSTASANNAISIRYTTRGRV